MSKMILLLILAPNTHSKAAVVKLWHRNPSPPSRPDNLKCLEPILDVIGREAVRWWFELILRSNRLRIVVLKPSVKKIPA